MRLLPAFLKLVRWPNLLFIALTQILFYYCILPFVYRGTFQTTYRILSEFNFYLLVIASTFIAAAGYIINDYFDLNIDRVNKPAQLIIERYIKRRYAILLHIVISFSGLVLSAYVGYKTRNVYIPLFNLLSIIALGFYSTTFKKKLLVGNIIISLLTAWVILVIMLAEYKRDAIAIDNNILTKLLKVSFLYAGFAFIISLIREVVKDMEDIQGDSKYNCQTMPIVWGIPVSKVFTAVWICVLAGILIIVQFYVWNLGWWLSSLYCIALILVPLIWILRKLYDARTSVDYHQLSGAIKTVMLTGIISMIFFRLYS